MEQAEVIAAVDVLYDASDRVVHDILSRIVELVLLPPAEQ